MPIGAQLRRVRSMAGITARQADRLTGKAPGQTALIEARGKDVRAGNLIPYAQLFGVSLDWLIAERGPDPDETAVRAAVQAAEQEAQARKKKGASGRPTRARPQDRKPPSTRRPKPHNKPGLVKSSYQRGVA